MAQIQAASYGKFVRLSKSHINVVAESIKQAKKYAASQLHNVARMELDDLQSAQVSTSFYAYEGLVDDVDRNCIVAVQYRDFYAKEMLTMSVPSSQFITRQMATEISTLIDWTAPNVHAFVPKKFAVDSGIYENLFGCREHQDGKVLTWDEETVKNFKFNLKDEFHFKKLSKDDVDWISKNWKWGNVGGSTLLKDSLGCFDSFGVFGEDGTLISATVFSNHGVLIALMTHPNYNKMGLGFQVLKKNAQNLAQNGFMPVGTSTVDSFSVKMQKNGVTQFICGDSLEPEDMLVIFPTCK